MNTGIEILLQRMKDCPEDFAYNPSTGMTRWSRLVDHAIADEIATEEEVKALTDALRETRRERFTEMVMKELAGEGETEPPKSNPYQATSATGLGGVTLGQSTGVHNNGLALTAGAGTGYQWANTATTTTTAQLQANSLTIGNTTLQEKQLQKLLELQVEEAKRKIKEQEKKQTLFGKLFNYT